MDLVWQNGNVSHLMLAELELWLIWFKRIFEVIIVHYDKTKWNKWMRNHWYLTLLLKIIIFKKWSPEGITFTLFERSTRLTVVTWLPLPKKMVSNELIFDFNIFMVIMCVCAYMYEIYFYNSFKTKLFLCTNLIYLKRWLNYTYEIGNSKIFWHFSIGLSNISV